MSRVAVVVGICVERDAISAAACAQAETLVDLLGADQVHLFTTHLARDTVCTSHVVADAWALLQHPDFRSCDVAIFHWGIVHPLFDALWLVDFAHQAVAVHFHNVTPLALVSDAQREVISRSMLQIEAINALPVHLWTYSEFNRRTLIGLGVEPQRIADVPFSIEPPRPLPRRERHAGIRLICAGRLVPAKGTATLIDAMALLRSRGRSDIRLTVAANEAMSADSYASGLRERVAELGLADLVDFCSPDDDQLWSLLTSSDIVVSPSLHEGLCVPIIEGYLAGTHAIGTTAGNLPFVVRAPDLVVEPGDATALADAIETTATRVGQIDPVWSVGVEALCLGFSRARAVRRIHDELRKIMPKGTAMHEPMPTPIDEALPIPDDDVRPWIDVQPDSIMRKRQRGSLNRLPDYADWEPGTRFTDILRDLQQPVTIHRKSWEYGLCILGLEQLGALTPEAAAIAVGAGTEPPLFHLANTIGRMVATDLYDNPDHEGTPAMLADPAAFAPFEYRSDRLEVYRMSGDQLEFADDTFDIAFSLSSIEHFGPRSTQRAAFDEMIRVVKPGGVICIMTELILTGHRHAEYFQWSEMADIFLDHEAVELVGGDIDLSISRSLVDYPLDPREAATLNRSPHIVLELDGMKWTSLSMFFRVR